MYKNIIVSAIAILSLFISKSALGVYSKDSSINENKYVTGEIIILFAPKSEGACLHVEEANSIVTNVCNGRIKYMSSLVKGLSLVEIPDDLSIEEAVKRFKNIPGIINVQPNYIYHLMAREPNDPCFSYLWGLNNTGQLYPHEKYYGGGFLTGTPDADINAPEAWDLRTNASDIIVAVIDSGIDYNHPDLAANMWHNPGEIPGNGIDDDDNGYIDDIYGWDFYSNDNNPMDEYLHGTHVAGIIGSVGNNGIGVTGVCWNVKLMALKIGGNGSSVNTMSAIQAIYYAISKGAKILNNSWGGRPNQEEPWRDVALYNAVEAANEAGVLFIASAGNEGFSIDYMPLYPAGFDCNNIISVMATDANDNKSDFSCYGHISVDLAAPGTDIFSTFPTYETPAMAAYGLSTNYETISGTSMSAPYVSGACALLWSYKPYLTLNEVKEGILETVDKIPSFVDESYYGGKYCVSAGRLNLYKALLYKPHLFAFSKQDSIPESNCVLPGAFITYTITYDANGHGDNSIRIVDYLPQEVTYDVNYDPNTGEWDQNYSPANHTYTWELGTVTPDGNGTVTLIVQVNNLAEPCGVITNHCEIEGDHIRNYAETSISVCAWNPGVVYVDADAPGSITGMSWKNAYLDLQTALTRTGNGCGSEIWVAAGTYKPSVPTPQSTFQVVAGVPVYGHFAGNETSLGQRNLKNLDNESILSGDNYRFSYVVTASDRSQGAILDGFTIKDASDGAIKIEKANLVVKNCLITGIRRYGIYANKSGFTISDCIIQDNNCVDQLTYGSGIYSNFDLNTVLPETRITNNFIRNNVRYNGMNLLNIKSPVLVANSRIHNNDNYGIYIYNNRTTNLTIQNNTIVSNGNYGIIGVGLFSTPTLRNCIVWGNNPEISGGSPTYSCIKGGYTGKGNISSDPCFTYPDNNDFHLKPASDCIDAGDPCFNDFNDRDIDGECRIIDGDYNGTFVVDMGADEFYWHKADFDRNEIINFIDFAIWAVAWQSIDPNKSLDVDSDVDIDDLVVFCRDWLWIAPWSELYGMLGSQSDGGGMNMGAEGATEPLGLANEMCATVDIEEPAASDEATDIEPLTVEDMVDWLDDIWQTGELTMNEQEYLEFRSALLKSAE